MIDIFTYIDFRKLLKDLYEDRKKQHAFFSYRYIAQKVGFSSPGFFTNIIQGKRNISSEYIFKFAQLFKFNKSETEYFELLVNFGQAKNHSQKKYYFEKILANKKSKITITDARHYEFYNKWYYTAVRELVDIFPVKDDYDELAKKVHPPIKPAEARKAIEFLEQIGFIRRNAQGYFEQTDTFISTGYEAKSVAITNFLISMMELARYNVERLPRDKRSMSTLTFSISEEGYDSIMKRLKSIHREILEMVREDRSHNKQDRVYHVNVQVFPLSKVQ
ncbi:MAG: TIGR02147 family protein [Chitinivibrionales bacterium]|nr:TIGR02147 family protein [Chitinivibrionales bacterium]